jgi:AcrR family transcriptional regulator
MTAQLEPDGTEPGSAEAGSRVQRFGPRSAATRQAILDAAGARFARDGYDRATIRGIAADAGIDPSMVIRYFGTKAELFRATSQRSIVRHRPRGVPLAELPDAYVASMLAVWETSDSRPQEQLLRTAVTHPEVAASAQALLDEEIFPAIIEALGDSPETRARAAMVAAHTMGVIFSRYLLKLEPLASMPVAELSEALRVAFETQLTRPIPSTPDA